MIRDLTKWVASGLATVLGGTSLCLALTSGAIANDLATHSAKTMASVGYNRAELALNPTLADPTVLQIAQAVVDPLAPGGSIVVLDPPRIADYWMSATRQSGGVVVFDGYAPDAMTRDAFSQRPSADTSYLQLGRGAPETYRSSVDFGLAALELMSEGRIALRGNGLTVTGIARSSGDYETLLGLGAAAAPLGMVLASVEIEAPRAPAYGWTATKDTTGSVALAGLVPNPDDAAILLAAAGANATETMTYASGAPGSFLTTAQTGLGLLQGLSEGRVVYEGGGWTITGTANSAIDKAAIEADFAAHQLAGAGWSMAIAAPVNRVAAAVAPEPATDAPPPDQPAPVAVAEASVTPASAPPAVPVVDPDYAFSASRAVDGPVILSGQLPTDAAMRYFSTISAGDSAAVSLAAGAPPNFLASAESGLRALLQLIEGQLNFVNGAWSISGLAADAATRDAVLAALDSGAANWANTITLPEAEAAVSVTPAVLAAPVDITACAAQVADFSARNAILFQSGAAIIAAESGAALDELARYLAACPEAVVHVQGHTDSDGAEALNLALSVARAEAVVTALIARGIGAARLYAVGYGEAAPVADNATAQGKRLNRRIVVIVQPQHF